MTIQKENGKPIYQQIVDHIIEQIQTNELKQGDKLLPERDLAATLGVSRGTVKKAYEFLVTHQYAHSEQGSGTFVTATALRDKPVNTLSAGESVNLMIDALKEKGFSAEEINLLVNVKLMNRLDGGDKLNIATVDCNPEALAIINRKFSYLSHANVMGFLLHDVMNFNFAREIFEDFDIIFTTTTHFNDLMQKMDFARGKIVKTVMTAHSETISKIVSIPDKTKVGVLTKTERFGEIIDYNMKKIGIELPPNSFITTKNLLLETLEEFIEGKEFLIMPPLFTMDLNLAIGNRILQFGHNDGEILTFNYTIERGIRDLYQRANITN